ncbi:hypothetical protein PAECIP111802_04616 [Paenibacillus allorhizosphaerae]|uniref:Uncharacterized protein n=1 Tax=Paenibacillus allorhizosphaerae TaxID=2849866 RepID=A0ABM8VMH9_9BACL|nr:hypothetical protein PAECIP111802_04616 [Paenibacillus allorhizosphaerae]
MMNNEHLAAHESLENPVFHSGIIDAPTRRRHRVGDQA